MKVLIESMTRLQIHELTIRCWRQEETYENTNHKGIEDLVIEKYNSLPNNLMTVYDVANVILSIDNMNAVEVINELGDGVVLYKNWP